MIESFRSKALKRFWEKDQPRGLKPEWIPKITIVLDALDAAIVPQELDIATFGFHSLTGDKAGQFAIVISRNWRITFAWSGEGAVDIDLEDYHGR